MKPVLGTLSYSARIAGVRMGRIAIAFSLFNILVLISRLSNSFQAPLLAKRIESNISSGYEIIPTFDFRIILLSSSAATIVGGLLIPTFQHLFSFAIARFSVERSIPRLLFHSFSKIGIRQFEDILTVPKAMSLSIKSTPLPPGLYRILLINVFGIAVWTVAVLSSLYAGYIVPELRVTASNLSGVINGVATLLMFLLVDPFISLLTDDAVQHKIGEAAFRRTVALLALSRFAGTIIAQVFLIPNAHIIAWVAQLL